VTTVLQSLHDGDNAALKWLKTTATTAISNENNLTHSIHICQSIQQAADLVNRFHRHPMQSVAMTAVLSPDQQVSMCGRHASERRRRPLSDWHSVSTESFDFCIPDTGQTLAQIQAQA